MMESFPNERTQYLVYIGLSLVVLGFTSILYFANRQVFQRLLGGTNPLIVFLAVTILGGILLVFSLSQNWFAIYAGGNLKGLLTAAGLAAIFGVIMILADTRIVFPADTNIPYPESLLFYPAIGFLAEILFHFVPLVVLTVILNAVFKSAYFETIL